MGSLRIIAGDLRGRRLRVLPGLRVRPTADRVREALFSILAGAVDGASVLDPFAGSGALGFEALSRGARSVTFVESDRSALACLRDNAAALGVGERCHLIAGDAERVIGRRGIGEPFDLVLVDAPYRHPLTGFLRALEEEPGRLAAGATVVVERDIGAPPADEALSALSVRDSRRYGRTRLDFLEI